MKVYFHASVGQRTQYGRFYLRIIKTLVSMEYQVEASHAIDDKFEDLQKRDLDPRLARDDYQTMMKRIMDCDVFICEVSYPSTVLTGHVLTRALQKGKPVLALYHCKSTPALLYAIESERLIVSEYSEENLENVLKFELHKLLAAADQRFTMLLPGDIVGYLEELAEQGKNRSEYIRDLIRKDMRQQ